MRAGRGSGDLGADPARARLADALRANGADLTAYFERRVTVRADAADLLGETMLHAWRRVTAMPVEAATEQRMWLFAIAANVLSNHRRGARRRAALAAHLRAHLSTRRTDDAPDQAVLVSLRAAIDRLPSRQREVVRLVHWDGFTLAQAAHVLGINPSTARSRYSEARAALKATLGDAEDDAARPPTTGRAAAEGRTSVQR
ncbi:RNA polymerase sigma factor [Nocardioides aquiterrae]|uniref:RNA polymerase sigma factor n=1 Tax=Nocardioides aquiterrae TaxID=203799 RepID=A0ABN1U7K2_9ACTN